MICVQRITITPQNIYMLNNRRYTGLHAEVLPANATCKNVKWKSSDPDIVSINESTGVMYSNAPGSVRITAEATDCSCVSARVHVTVVAQPVTNITLNHSSTNVGIGETTTLTATVSPEDASYKRISWESANESIATVDENGVITGIAAGSTTITATAMDGSGVSNCCEVTVVPIIKDDVEYHLLCSGDTNKALRVGTRNVFELTEDLPIRGERLSYWNRQKWIVKSFGDKKKLFTQLDNNYCLCDNGSNEVYISQTADDSDSKIIITPYENSDELYEIKLANSELYLTLVYNSSDQLYWAIWQEKNTSNTSNQVWKFVEQPNNHLHGVDSYTPISESTANVLIDNNKDFAIRYYTSLDSDKLLTANEVEIIHNANLKIVSIYQDDGRDIDSFSETAANANAIKALELASALEQPINSAIYFAVDYSPSDNEINTIKRYFQIIKNKLDGKYKVGVYGRAKICEIIKTDCADYSWLAHSTGATASSPEGDSDYIAYDSQKKYNIKQSEPISYNGVEFDNDTAIGPDFGQW